MKSFEVMRNFFSKRRWASSSGSRSLMVDRCRWLERDHASIITSKKCYMLYYLILSMVWHCSLTHYILFAQKIWHWCSRLCFLRRNILLSTLRISMLFVAVSNAAILKCDEMRILRAGNNIVLLILFIIFHNFSHFDGRSSFYRHLYYRSLQLEIFNFSIFIGK